jgi:hypothetical protein
LGAQDDSCAPKTIKLFGGVDEVQPDVDEVKSDEDDVKSDVDISKTSCEEWSEKHVLLSLEVSIKNIDFI